MSPAEAPPWAAGARGGSRGGARGGGCEGSRGGGRESGDDDRGTVTAELALGLPAVVSVLLAVLLLSAAAGAQLRCADGARAGARAAALGEDVTVVNATAARVAGSGAAVSVRVDGTWVTVTVRRPVAAGPFGGTWTAQARASAPVEP